MSPASFRTASFALSVVLMALSFGEQASSQPRQAKAAVSIVSLTDGAEVFVNGALVGTIPLSDPLLLPPGEHVIKVTKRGYVDYYEVHRVRRGQQELTIEADLLPFSGVVIIQTEPAGAQVLVDGELLGETPFEGEVESGQRQLELVKSGFKTFASTAAMSAGDTYFLNLKLEPAPSEPFYSSWWFWGAVSAVAVGASVGVVLLNSEEERAPSGPQPDRTLMFGLGF